MKSTLNHRRSNFHTGTVDAPIFSPWSILCIYEAVDESFVVVTAAVPEPSTWAMMLLLRQD